jgi:hypothetical protein
VTIDRPSLRLTRTAAGTLLWPSLPPNVVAAGTPHAPPSSLGARPLPASWRIRAESLRVLDGAIELVDERPATPFRGMLDHLSFDVGPVMVPLAGSPRLTFAVRANVVGAGGHAAPLYCSGWVEFTEQDLQASCKLDPLPLAAFEPYLRGSPEVRVYDTTLALTSQWSARANALTGRVQLELANLREGDLSVNGRTIVDVKQLISSADPRLTAELSVYGPLNEPGQWHAQFLPGNEAVQGLVDRLLEHGVRVVRLPFWNGHLPARISPASEATMTDIEATAKEIREALQILVVPMPEDVAPAAPAPAAPADVEAAPPAPPTEPAAPAPAPSASPAPTGAPKHTSTGAPE